MPLGEGEACRQRLVKQAKSRTAVQSSLRSCITVSGMVQTTRAFLRDEHVDEGSDPAKHALEGALVALAERRSSREDRLDDRCSSVAGRAVSLRHLRSVPAQDRDRLSAMIASPDATRSLTSPLPTCLPSSSNGNQPRDGSLSNSSDKQSVPGPKACRYPTALPRLCRSRGLRSSH